MSLSGRVETQLLVDLVAADLGQVVALAVEVEVVEQRLRGLAGGRLARAQLAVDVEERLVLRGGVVLLEREVDRLVRTELFTDLRVVPAERLEQHGDVLLALAVDADRDDVLLVDLELEPGTARRDDLGGEDVLVRGLVDRALEVDAGRADELRHDDPLGAVDDEGALVGHQREVAHEDRLRLDLTGLVVHELGRDEQRRRVGEVAVLALFDRVLRGLEPVVAEAQRHGALEVLDRADLLEDLLEAGLVGDGLAGGGSLVDPSPPHLVAQQPVEALDLEVEQIGDCEGLGDLGETQPGRWWCWGGAELVALREGAKRRPSGLDIRTQPVRPPTGRPAGTEAWTWAWSGRTGRLGSHGVAVTPVVGNQKKGSGQRKATA